MARGTAPQQPAKSKGARRRRRLFLTLLGLFSVWAAFALWDQSGDMKDKKQELMQLQLKLDEVRAENEAFKMEVTRLQDPEYIEQRVRKDFGMVRPGDKVFGTPVE